MSIVLWNIHVSTFMLCVELIPTSLPHYSAHPSLHTLRYFLQDRRWLLGLP